MIPSTEKQPLLEFLMASHRETLAPAHPAKRDVSEVFKRLDLRINFSPAPFLDLAWLPLE